MKKKISAWLVNLGKHCKKESSDNLTAMLLPSILGIILCAFCLVGSTWAWFTASQSTAPQTITAANYDVSVTVTLEKNTISSENGIYSLAAGKYTVSFTTVGDATTGYCIVDFDGTEIHTEQIAKGASIVFYIDAEQPVTLKITPQWGTSTHDINTKIKSGDTISVSSSFIGKDNTTK